MSPEHAKDQALGVVTTLTAYRHRGSVAMHMSMGRVAEALARHYRKLYLCASVLDGAPSAVETTLQAPNIELIAQPYYTTTASALKHVVGITRAYLEVYRRSDVLLLCGLCPYVGVLYALAFVLRRPVCHWIIGNPIALLRSHARRNRLADGLALAYAWQDRIVSRVGRWLTKGAFVCNGRELAVAYRSPRTVVTASSTVTKDEFFIREDTCQGDTIHLLFVAYLRPEKGVEYLLEAVAQLRLERPWKLTLVGSDQFPKYRRKLDQVAARAGVADRLHWAGHVSYDELFRYMRQADVFVLPSLSEGTPHVLVETRVNSLPSISTTVGGVPTTVTDGVDAVLVPPKDPAAIARAIERIVNDGELRRALIRNGLASARKLTVDRFAEIIVRSMGAGAESVR